MGLLHQEPLLLISRSEVAGVAGVAGVASEIWWIGIWPGNWPTEHCEQDGKKCSDN